jgi:hypothetical protein
MVVIIGYSFLPELPCLGAIGIMDATSAKMGDEKSMSFLHVQKMYLGNTGRLGLLDIDN